MSYLAFFAWQLLGMMSAVSSIFFIGFPAYGDINWDLADGSLQVTELVFDATVVDGGGVEQSANGGWISAVHYPDPATGLPADDPGLTFTYYNDGSVASRTDARGIRLDYTLDELGRTTQVLVDDTAWYDPEDEDAPAQRIHKVTYEYTPNGELSLLTAYTLDGSTYDVVSQNQFDYDSRHHLLTEWQQHGNVVGSNTLKVDYEWELSPVGEESYNFDRLVSATYPARPGGGARREVNFNYGNNTNDADSAVSRITEIEDDEKGTLAEYAYAGTMRRVESELGNGINQSFTGTNGYPKLDHFGRVIDLDYKTTTASLYRHQYGYDAAGNRTFARVTQQTFDGTSHDNDRSYLYGYDDLRQLISTEMGALNTANDDITPVDGVDWSTEWNLDFVGNWSGDGYATDGLTSVTRTGDFDGDGDDETESIHHVVDSTNKITELDVTPEGETMVETAFIHDPDGNLVWDGVYYYQYDAWNRLIRVSELGTATLDTDTGQIIGGALAQPAVVLYAYDGLGRLIRRKGVTTLPCDGDLNNNGVVNPTDRGLLLAMVAVDRRGGWTPLRFAPIGRLVTMVICGVRPQCRDFNGRRGDGRHRTRTVSDSPRKNTPTTASGAESGAVPVERRSSLPKDSAGLDPRKAAVLGAIDTRWETWPEAVRAAVEALTGSAARDDDHGTVT